jgi:hypothetical protein
VRFSKKDKRCYVLVAYAPEGTSIRNANEAFNDFIADTNRGLVVFHDHFIGIAGGIALFWVENPETLAALQEPDTLKGWNLRLHPLIFTDSPLGFLYQIDWAMTVYRQKRLGELVIAYQGSEYARSIDQRAVGMES